MIKSQKREYITGFVLGFVVFIIIIPSIIYAIAQTGLFNRPLMYIDILRYLIVALLFSIGLVFMIWSNIDLFRKGKGGPTDVFNVRISPRTKVLVVTGPYRFTRNPMVFGAHSMYFAIAILLNSIAALIFCLLFLFAIVFYLKRTEEKRLLKDFGEEYLAYKKRVPMLIPFLSVRG